MGFIGGTGQQELAQRMRGSSPERHLAIPIDVGKRSAKALMCDFWGEVVVAPFEFGLDEEGFRSFAVTLAQARAERDIEAVRVGVEAAGHYHRLLSARLKAEALEVVHLNPSQVKEDRAQDLLRGLKSDARDLGAIADLIIRGKGRVTGPVTSAMFVQNVLIAHRMRKVKARTALKNQILATLDLVFPGLDQCFCEFFGSPFARLLLEEGLTPARVRRLGPARLFSFCSRRGVKTTRRKVAQVHQAAVNAFVLPTEQAEAYRRVLCSDVRLLGRLDQEIEATEAELAEVLPSTPARVLTTMPHVSVVRASMYGAALGDPARFCTAAQVYRLSGLVPKLYESAGRRRAASQISREGQVDLRRAILDLGMGHARGIGVRRPPTHRQLASSFTSSPPVSSASSARSLARDSRLM